MTMSKEESVIIKITKEFSNEKILLQYSVLDYQIDLYFLERKLAIEVDEKGHTDRDEKRENEREEKIKKWCKFNRINLDAENYDIFVEIGKMQNQVIESTKKSLIDDLSKRLLELEFKQHNAIKSKCLKWVAKNILPNYKKWKTHNQK